MKKILTGLSLILALSTPAAALDKSNVITSSAKEYLESVQRNIVKYNLVGVHIRMEANETIGEVNKTGKLRQCPEYLVQQAPKNTEVIVDYKEIGDKYVISCSGTALIKK